MIYEVIVPYLKGGPFDLQTVQGQRIDQCHGTVTLARVIVGVAEGGSCQGRCGGQVECGTVPGWR